LALRFHTITVPSRDEVAICFMFGFIEALQRSEREEGKHQTAVVGD
jgi:hypothetical protein